MPPKAKPAEAVAPAIPEDDVSMNDEPAVNTLSPDDDPHNPARMAFGEQRIRIVSSLAGKELEDLPAEL